MKALTVALFLVIYLTITIHTRDTSYNRIVGGNLTYIAKHRYMVSLILYRRYTTSILDMHKIEKYKKDVCLCAGTIIGEYWVLTAATCIIDWKLRMEQQHVVVRGNTTFCSYGKSRMDHLVVRSKVHEKFLTPIRDKFMADENYNIGLLKVSKSFTGYYERKIKLYSPKALTLTFTMLNRPWYLAGWGSTEPRSVDFKPSNQLKYVDVYYINPLLCRRSVRYSDRIELQSVNNICVEYLEGKGSCFADTGGPLYFELGNDIWQMGIIPSRDDFGDNQCTSSDTSGIYIAVSTFYEWISKNTARAADHLYN